MPAGDCATQVMAEKYSYRSDLKHCVVGKAIPHHTQATLMGGQDLEVLLVLGNLGKWQTYR